MTRKEAVEVLQDLNNNYFAQEFDDANEAIEIAIQELNGRREIYKEDLEFIMRMQSLLISEHGWVIDTGNYQTVNEEMIRRLEENISRHPLIWKWLFMVA